MACCYLLRISILGSGTWATLSWVNFATYGKAHLVLQKEWLAVQRTFGSLYSCQQAIYLYMTQCPPLREFEATKSSSSHCCRLYGH